ncbi:cadherin-related family member 5 isoform X1 [Pantherophis guttatus]|uniref:Cadherin-related family member 5 isoform X1 n=1 Tax=Pantherophis guttatus TaxID=94885 RepID=A0A6P9C4E6_PANGU|nr:cadherin-related family member 5 isoform X1 [Pantherophis guttatus]
MAFLRPFCSCVLFLLLSVTQVETQNAICSADNTFVDIMENNNPGLVVTNIHADPGIIVTIKPSTEATSPSEWFEIKDSQLILKKSVDYETITLLQLELICWKADLQVKSIIVLISIQNENDNEPVFKQTNITVHVPEDTKVNTTVVPLPNVTASDADLNTVYYSLEGSTSEAMDYFNIQGINNPQIYLRKALDYEAINFMRFTLRAMDGSADEAGTHTATATISIWIVQSDLKPPWFQPCTAIGGGKVCISLGYTSKVNLSEEVSGPLILEPGPLYAIDGDKSLNEKVIYEIAAGNDNNTFKINRDSGNITMTQPANTLKTFMLYIVASQENNAFRYSQTTVKIDVVRKNDNRPYFEEAVYLGRVSEAQPAKSLIMKANTSSEPLQIFAADDDFLPDKINPDIKYRIQNSSDFRVTAEGFIQTTKILNVSSHINLWAIATDISTLEEASTLISIDVTPLATPTPAVPPVTTTAFTETSPTSPGKGNTSQKPSTLPPGISSPKPSGSTTSMSPLSSTTGKDNLTEITRNPGTVSVSGSVTQPFVTTLKPPVIPSNSTQFLTTSTLVTERSQWTEESIKNSSPTTTQAPSQSGAPKPTPPSNFITSGGSVQSSTSSKIVTTKTPTTSSVPDGDRQSTTPLLGTIKPSTTGISTTKSNYVSSISLSSTTATSTLFVANTSATSRISKSSISTSSASTSTSMFSTKPIIKVITTPSVNEAHNPGSSTIPSKTNPEGPFKVNNMAALGGTLGTLLAIALTLLALISYKYYKLKKELEKENSQLTESFSNANFQDDENSDENDDESPTSLMSKSYARKEPEKKKTQSAHKTIQEEIDIHSEKEVRSILTKDRKTEDDGYKSVWFKEDVTEVKSDDVMIDEDSDLEQNRLGSDDVSGAEKDDDHDDTNSGRGDSDVNMRVRRGQVFDTSPSTSRSLDEAEEQDDTL